MEIRPVRMQFDYHAEFGAYTPEAYQRLLLEVIANDSTLFIRRDEVETAWSIVDPIRQAWTGLPLAETDFYPAGFLGAGRRGRTAGPAQPQVADDLRHCAQAGKAVAFGELAGFIREITITIKITRGYACNYISPRIGDSA